MTNPKGPKETMQSIFNSNEERTDVQTKETKHNQLLDSNVLIFNDMEKHADDHHSHHSSMVDEADGEPLTEAMQIVKDAELRELKAREDVCRDSAELKEMNKEMNQALLRKDYALQIEEKEHKKQEDKIMDQFYSDQRVSASERHLREDELHEEAVARRKAEYRRDLEAQMAAEQEKKKEAKYRQYLEEQQLSRAEIDRMVEQDRVSREDKQNKKTQLREDMREAIKSREEGRHQEKMKNEELERNVETYWEKSSRNEHNQRQEQQARQQSITERQEICAQSLQEIHQRKQSRSDLLDSMSMLTQQARQDTGELRQDLECADRKLRQTELCCELDGQVADKVRAKRDAKQESGDFHETWIWGSDAATQRGDQAEKLRKQRECADYNRATVREHEEQKRSNRHCMEAEDGENAAEGVFKQRLIDEEEDRLSKAQEEE